MQGKAVSWSRRALSHWQEGHEVTLQLPQSHGIPPLFLGSPFPPPTPPLWFSPLQVLPRGCICWMVGWDFCGQSTGFPLCNTPYALSMPRQLFDSPVTHLGFS